jgi:type IV secretory pathway TraG/TraD family ATPase VirD4
VAQIGTVGLGRADVREESRRDFHLYLDEFQTFATLHMAEMLSELRKYRVNLILAHQYLAQLDHEVRDPILGNVGTIVCFRIGAEDAVILKREFAPEFEASTSTGCPTTSSW